MALISRQEIAPSVVSREEMPPPTPTVISREEIKEPDALRMGNFGDTIQGAKSLAGGALGNVIASPQAAEELGTIGKVVPNIVWKGLQLPGMAVQAYDALTDGENDPNSLLNRPMQYANSGRQAAYDMTDSGKATNSYDAAMETVGEIAGMPMRAPIAAMEKVSPIAAGVGTVLVPGMQATTKAGMVGENMFGAALYDTIEEFTDPVYTSSVSKANLDPSIPPVTKDILDGQPPLIPEQVAPGTGEYLKLQQTVQRAMDNGVTGANREDTDRSTGFINEVTAVGQGLWDNKLASAAVLTAGAMIGRSYVKSRLTRDAAEIADNASTLTGQTKRMPADDAQKVETLARGNTVKGGLRPDPEGVFVRNPADKSGPNILNAQLFDSLSPLHWMIEDAKNAGKITAARARNLRDSVTTKLEPRAVATQFKDFMQSGFAPGHTTARPLKGKPFAETMDEWASLPPEQHGVIRDILAAETKADDLNRMFRAKNTPAPTWGGRSAVVLNAKARRLRKANPEAARIADEAQNLPRLLRKYMHRNGRITNNQAKIWAERGQHYVPTRLTKDREFDPNSFRPRNNPTDVNAIQPDEMDDSFQLLADYAAGVVKEVENNTIRRRFLKTMMDENPMGTRGGKKLFEPYRGKDAAARNDPKVVSYYDRGVEKFVKVNDPHFKLVLEAHPKSAAGAFQGTLNVFRRIANLKKTFTTGRLSTFAPTGAHYDSVMMMLTKNQDTAIGMLSAHLDNAVTRRIDPSALLNPLTGTIQNIYSTVSNRTATKLMTDLNTNGYLTQMLGEKTTAMLATQARQNYLNASKRSYEQHGGGSSPTWAASGGDTESIPELLAEIAPKYARNVSQKTMVQANGLYRVWNMVNDSIHGSSRTASYGYNLKRARTGEGWAQLKHHENVKLADGRVIKVPYIGRKIVSSPEDMAFYARTMRETGGDLGKKGGIKGSTFEAGYTPTLDSIIYSNVALQSGVTVARAMKHNPIGVIGGTLTYFSLAAAYIIDNIMSDPVKAERYNAESETSKARKVPIYDDEGNIALNMSIPNELRPAWSPFIQAVLGLYNSNEGLPPEATHQGSWQQAFNIFAKDVLVSTIPQAVKAGLAVGAPMVGKQTPNQWMNSPEYYSSELEKGTSKDTIIQSVQGLLDNIAGPLVTNVVDGGIRMYENIDDGDDTRKKVNDFMSYLGAHEAVEGRPAAYLFKETMEQRVPVDGSEDAYAYENTYKIGNWLRKYDAMTKHAQSYSASPKDANGFRTEAQLAPLKDDREAAIIASHLKNFQRKASQVGYANKLQAANIKKKEAKYGGTVFDNKPAQAAADNIARREQKVVLDEQADELLKLERMISDSLGREWTLDEMTDSPATSGYSSIVPVTTPFMR